jgi:DNA polymerase IIIc chi subunit
VANPKKNREALCVADILLWVLKRSSFVPHKSKTKVSVAGVAVVVVAEGNMSEILIVAPRSTTVSSVQAFFFFHGFQNDLHPFLTSRKPR